MLQRYWIPMMCAALVLCGCEAGTNPVVAVTPAPGKAPGIEKPAGNAQSTLERHVKKLAEAIGVRDGLHPDAERAAANYIEAEFRSISERVSVQDYEIDGVAHRNLCLEIPGSVHGDEIVVVGAHYDTALGTPGADDNASGVAALIVLAQRFAAEASQSPPQRRLRFVAFSTEEPPYIRTPDMGSYRYAQLCSERGDKIVAMLSIEMIGYFSDEPGTQKGPFPQVGNFLLFAGHSGNAQIIREARQTFVAASATPAEVVVLSKDLVVSSPMALGANSSDQWSFWHFDYPGFMATDTANWRNPHYHKPSDSPEKLDYRRMVNVVDGLAAVLRRWTSGAEKDKRETTEASLDEPVTASSNNQTT